ncbi:hypothetical protein BJF78_30760 [Pseudonocardia sp. CNS-139]|nr:hypothetical protein BJF78_30760 [Pseudonocardia sp. CNS-139]
MPMSAPYRCSAAGETIMPRVPSVKPSAKSIGNSASGWVSVNSTVSGSAARIVPIVIAAACAGDVALSRCRCTFTSTAAASRVVPSWNRTSGRRCSSHVRPASGVTIDSAR